MNIDIEQRREHGKRTLNEARRRIDLDAKDIAGDGDVGVVDYDAVVQALNGFGDVGEGRLPEPRVLYHICQRLHIKYLDVMEAFGYITPPPPLGKETR